MEEDEFNDGCGQKIPAKKLRRVIYNAGVWRIVLEVTNKIHFNKKPR